MSSNLKKKLSSPFAALIAVLLCALIIWGVSSSWGGTTINRVVYTGTDGVQNSYLMFVPDSATTEAPAPAAIVVQGGSSTAHRFDSFSMELARRGFVVLAVDKEGAGFSRLVDETALMQNMVDYLKSLEIVRPEEIHLIGHSGGTWAVSKLAAANYGEVASVCFCHTSINALPRFADDPGTNFYFILSEADFGLFDTEGVNAQLARWFDMDTVEDGVIYGSFENKDAHMLYWDKKPVIHAAATWAPEVIATFLTFIGNISPEATSIAPPQQVWQWCAVFGLLGMLASVWLLLALVMKLLSLKFFESIKRPVAREMGFRGWRWALSAALSIVGGVGLYLLREKIFDTSVNSFFNSKGVNMITPYLIMFEVYELVLFFVLFYLPRKKEDGLNAYEIGLSWGEGKPFLVQIGKCALVAIIVESVMLTMFHFMEAFGGINFQFLFVSFNAITLNRVWQSLGYMLMFIFIFFASNFSQNITRRLKTTGSDTKDLAIAMVINAVLAALPTAILSVAQVVAHHNHFEYLHMNFRHMYGTPFMFAYAAMINTYLYRKTGNSWLGILVNALFIGIFAASAQPYDMNFLGLMPF